MAEPPSFLLTVPNARALAGVSVVAGTLVELISGLNFVLYGKASAQLSHFHEVLDRTQRLLLANSICESISGELREKTRSSLVFEIIKAGRHSIASDSSPQTLPRARGKVNDSRHAEPRVTAQRSRPPRADPE